LPGDDQAFLGEGGESMPYAGRPQPAVGHLAHRWEPISRPELPGRDHLGDRIGDLPVTGSRVSGIHRECRHIPVLGERPAVAGEITAAAQPGIEVVQHWAAQLTQLHVAQGRLDGTPDVPLVTLPGGNVQVGHGHVLAEQVSHCGRRLRPLTDSSLLQQPRQLRLSVIGGLGGCL
jgi:hypothetical protein